MNSPLNSIITAGTPKASSIKVAEAAKVIENTQRDLTYDAIVLAVAHAQFLQLGAASIHALGKSCHVLYDVKSLLGKAESDGRL